MLALFRAISAHESRVEGEERHEGAQSECEYDHHRKPRGGERQVQGGGGALAARVRPQNVRALVRLNRTRPAARGLGFGLEGP